MVKQGFFIATINKLNSISGISAIVELFSLSDRAIDALEVRSPYLSEEEVLSLAKKKVFDEIASLDNREFLKEEFAELLSQIPESLSFVRDSVHDFIQRMFSNKDEVNDIDSFFSLTGEFKVIYEEKLLPKMLESDWIN